MTRPVFAPQKKLARVERSSPLRLLDCPGVAEMERRADLDPSLAALSAAERDDAIIDLNESLFGDLSEIRMTGEQWDRLCEMLDGGEHEKAK